jgi:type III secretory pathway component EscS
MEAIQAFTLPFPVDYIIVFAIFALSGFWAFQGGGTRAAAAILSFPFALFIYDRVNDAAILGDQLKSLAEMPYINLAVYSIAFFLMYLLLRSITNDYGGASGLTFQSLLIGLSATAMIMATWYTLPFTENLWKFGEQIEMLFAPEYLFWWMIASFVVLYTAARRL